MCRVSFKARRIFDRIRFDRSDEYLRDLRAVGLNATPRSAPFVCPRITQIFSVCPIDFLLILLFSTILHWPRRPHLFPCIELHGPRRARSFKSCVLEKVTMVNGSRRIFWTLIGKIGNHKIRLVPSRDPWLSESRLIVLVLFEVVRRYRTTMN